MKDFRLVQFSFVLARLACTVVGCSKQAETPRGAVPAEGAESRRSEAASIPAPATLRTATSASITLDATNASDGMTLVNETGDGATQVASLDGVACRLIQRLEGSPPVYIYFRLEPDRKIHPAEVLVTVEYFDDASGSITLDYDSFDEFSKNPAYTRIPTRVELKNDRRWHKAAFVLEKPRFGKGMHDGGDFRIALTGSHVFVRTVRMTQE